MCSRIVQGLAASGLAVALLALLAVAVSAEAQTGNPTPQTRLVGVITRAFPTVI